MMSETQSDPYVKIVATLEEALHEGSATALTKPLRTQLHTDREQRMRACAPKKEVLVPQRLLSMLWPTPSTGSPVMVTVPSTVPSTISLDVVTSSTVPALSAQSQSALVSGSPGAPSIQL